MAVPGKLVGDAFNALQPYIEAWRMTPAMNALRASSFLLLSFILGTGSLHASRQDDSLHTDVDGLSSSAARARALLSIANAQAKDQPGESLLKTATAVEFAERSNDTELLLRAVRQQRELEFNGGAYDQFLLSSIRAVSISERLADRRGLAEDMRHLCDAYERIGAFDKAVEASRQALFLLKSTGDSAAIGKGIVDLMNAMVMAGRFNEVLHQSDEALAYYSARNDTVGQASVWMGRGEALLAQERPADALPALSRAERVFRAMGMTQQLTRVLKDLCEANIALHRWDDARFRLHAAMAMAAESRTINTDPQLFAFASLIFEGMGDMKSALSCQRRHAELKDSLFNERMAERMLGLQALYSNARKDIENTSLRSRNTANEDMIARGRARSKWWLLAVVVLVVGSVSLFLMGRRLRRLVRRAHLKNQVIQRQTDEIKAKNMELERQNLRLAETLVNEEEKDLLLKEIHHRVKNNLQIVNTLLKMQGSFTHDPVLDEVLGDCQGRVRSMALVHEHIYRCGDLSRVNVKAHILALGEAILKHHGLNGRVSLDLNVNYDRSTLDNLIPMSLLLNELITNSAKHAFPSGADGRITIVLRRMGEHQCELVFSDDGVGMEQNRFFQSESFGLELVRALATQLNGSIRLLKGEGTTFQMTFEPLERPLRKAS